jgi:hypothetical protein
MHALMQPELVRAAHMPERHLRQQTSRRHSKWECRPRVVVQVGVHVHAAVAAPANEFQTTVRRGRGCTAGVDVGAGRSGAWGGGGHV